MAYRIIVILIIISGIILRFWFSLIRPNINSDEIALVINILNTSWGDILKPFTNFQSAPPLYIIVQKLAANIFPFETWANLKILGFVSSSASLLLFGKLLSKYPNYLKVLGLIIFAYNPFILYNSLTIKQYNIDLLGIIILLYSFNSPHFKKWGWAFFSVWILASNVALFAVAGYLLFSFYYAKAWKNNQIFAIFLRNNWKYLVAPIPYIIYFIWYMNQPNGLETKIYMQKYWSYNFIPLNSGIFKMLLVIIHSIYIYLINAYEILGLFLLIIGGLGIANTFGNKKNIFTLPISLCLFIFFIHLVLNLLKFYPISDRLFLYLSAPTILFILAGFSTLEYFRLFKKIDKKKILVPIISIIVFFSYLTYLPAIDNDVAGLYRTLEKQHNPSNKVVFTTSRALNAISAYNWATNNYFTSEKVQFIHGFPEQSLKSGGLYVSKVQQKIGPKNKTSKEETETQHLLEQNRISLLEKEEGYNIYTIVR